MWEKWLLEIEKIEKKYSSKINEPASNAQISIFKKMSKKNSIIIYCLSNIYNFLKKLMDLILML